MKNILWKSKEKLIIFKILVWSILKNKNLLSSSFQECDGISIFRPYLPVMVIFGPSDSEQIELCKKQF